MGDCSCDPEEEFRQAQEALQKLAHRLADGRLRQVAQKIKQQQKWDKAPRHTEYEGHNANGGLIKPLGGGARQAQPISNGWLKPGDVVEVGSKGGFDFKPRAREIEAEEKVVTNKLEIISEYVGNCVTYTRENANPLIVENASQFPIFSNINGQNTIFYNSIDSYTDFKILPPLTDNNILDDEGKVSIYRANKILNLKNSSDSYLYESSYRFPELEDLRFAFSPGSKISGKNYAYACFSKKFNLLEAGKVPSLTYNASRFFAKPIEGLKRTKCEDLLRLRRGLNQEQKEEFLQKCKNAISWTIGSISNGVPIVAGGNVSEEGFLIVKFSAPIGSYYYFDPSSYVYSSGGINYSLTIRIL